MRYPESDLTWTEENRSTNNKQRETEDLNTQEGNEGSGNTCGDTADTNNHDITGKSKTKHIKHRNKTFKIKQKTWRDMNWDTEV